MPRSEKAQAVQREAVPAARSAASVDGDRLNDGSRVRHLQAMADRLNNGLGPSSLPIQRAAEAPESWENLLNENDAPQQANAAAPAAAVAAAVAPARDARQELRALNVGAASVVAFLGRAGADPTQVLDEIAAAAGGQAQATAAGVGVLAAGGDVAAAKAAAQTFATAVGWTADSVTVAGVVALVNAGAVQPAFDRKWPQLAHTGRAYSFTLVIGGQRRKLKFEWHAHWANTDRPTSGHFKRGATGTRGAENSADELDAMKAILLSKGWEPA